MSGLADSDERLRLLQSLLDHLDGFHSGCDCHDRLVAHLSQPVSDERAAEIMESLFGEEPAT